jgi:LysM repeat protein
MMPVPVSGARALSPPSRPDHLAGNRERPPTSAWFAAADPGARALSPIEPRLDRRGYSTSHGSPSADGRTLSPATAGTVQPGRQHGISSGRSLSPVASPNPHDADPGHRRISITRASSGADGQTLSPATAGTAQPGRHHRISSGRTLSSVASPNPHDMDPGHRRVSISRASSGTDGRTLPLATAGTAQPGRHHRISTGRTLSPVASPNPHDMDPGHRRISITRTNSGTDGQTLPPATAGTVQPRRHHRITSGRTLSLIASRRAWLTHLHESRRRGALRGPARALSPAVGGTTQLGPNRECHGMFISRGGSGARALSLAVTDRGASVGGGR